MPLLLVYAVALVALLCHRATPLDIFNFFENHAVIAESLQLGVDVLGRPSGEAWLTFSSSDEALRAVRERNRHYLGNRYLELSLT
jgi:heterogeneous nuclear ribonucleoprotein F/H/epithelial splicing regulatory protein 1/2